MFGTVGFLNGEEIIFDGWVVVAKSLGNDTNIEIYGKPGLFDVQQTLFEDWAIIPLEPETDDQHEPLNAAQATTPSADVQHGPGTNGDVAGLGAHGIDAHLPPDHLRDDPAERCTYCGADREAFGFDARPLCEPHALAERAAAARSPLVGEALCLGAKLRRT